jgi:hypothetical protein
MRVPQLSPILPKYRQEPAMNHADEFARTWAAVRPSLLQVAGGPEEPLSPADGGAMFLAAAVMAMGACLPVADIAQKLRTLADTIEQPRGAAH